MMNEKHLFESANTNVFVQKSFNHKHIIKHDNARMNCKKNH